jgi:choline-sulfatase
VAFVGLREPHPPWIGSKEYFETYLPLVRVPEVTTEELERIPLPYQVMRNFKRISTPIPQERIRRAIAAYLSMVSELDGHIGHIYDALQETRQLDNTIFIYTSDHGESLGEHGMWLKNNLYEGPAHIPLVMSGPGLPKGKVIDNPVSHLDLVATMLEWSGMKIPAGLRGRSLTPLVDGKGIGPEFVYAESHSEGNPTGSFMIRKGDWKLVHFSYYGDYLFNLKDDPAEKHNRADDPAARDVLKELQSILRKQVDPEEVTERAFTAQKKVLDGLVGKMNEEQLFEYFRSRMGDGQARVIAKSLKRRKG